LIDSRFLRWIALAALSALAVGILELMRLPAALLLGAMAAAIALASMGISLRVSQPIFYLAQGIIGCMIARALPISLLAEAARSWPIFVGGVLSVVIAGAALGWLLARFAVLPGATAVWGLAPGAATAMALMAQSQGADIRLVALMQYMRVIVVAIVATLVAKVAAPSAIPSAVPLDFFPAFSWIGFAATLAIVVVGAFAGTRVRLAAGPLLVPLAISLVLQNTGVMEITLPPWFLGIAYVAIGWSIGLRFDRESLRHATRTLPAMLASIFALVAICGGLSVILVHVAGVSPLTAYLALSPGGADSVAIIAAASHVNLPFVMSMQTMRLLLLLVTGPSISRFVAAHSGPPQAS
jgi:hypothetical protein